jgi:hypothetical protein
MGNYRTILMQIGKQTKKNLLILKITIPEVKAKFQDGRRHARNSSECYKMGNYHPISMKLGTQTKENMLSSTVIKRKLTAKKQQKLNVKTISF